MKKELLLNKITWALLVLLVLTSSFVAESFLGISIFLIVSFTVIKFLLVSFQFMEVKNAHFAWKGLILIFVLIYIGGAFLFLY